MKSDKKNACKFCSKTSLGVDIVFTNKFLVFGFESVKGHQDEVETILCQTAKGRIFDCKPSDSFEVKYILSLIGQYINVKYHQLNEDDLPLDAEYKPMKQ